MSRPQHGSWTGIIRKLSRDGMSRAQIIDEMVRLGYVIRGRSVVRSLVSYALRHQRTVCPTCRGTGLADSSGHELTEGRAH